MVCSDGRNRDLHTRNNLIEQSGNQNQSPASDEHHHGHLHHDTCIDQNHREEVVSINSATNEKISIPIEELLKPHIQPNNHSDALESQSAKILNTENVVPGYVTTEADLQAYNLSNYYIKYRIFFHLLTWLFFTG